MQSKWGNVIKSVKEALDLCDKTQKCLKNVLVEIDRAAKKGNAFKADEDRINTSQKEKWDEALKQGLENLLKKKLEDDHRNAS